MSRREERGTALVELTWLAILLLVPLVYVVLAVFEVQRAAFAVTAAARSAGRAYVLAPTGADADARARVAADVALRDQGLRLTPGGLAVSCRPRPGDCLAAGSMVRVEVVSRVVLPFLPSALGRNAPSIRVVASHTVPYGSFREDRP